jgi:hypothetical protein
MTDYLPPATPPPPPPPPPPPGWQAGPVPPPPPYPVRPVQPKGGSIGLGIALGLGSSVLLGALMWLASLMTVPGTNSPNNIPFAIVGITAMVWPGVLFIAGLVMAVIPKTARTGGGILLSIGIEILLSGGLCIAALTGFSL